MISIPKGLVLFFHFQLPRNLRQLYAHSYQSLVWNKVASRRIQELGVDEGDRALVGDLYFADCPSISKGTFYDFCA